MSAQPSIDEIIDGLPQELKLSRTERTIVACAVRYPVARYQLIVEHLYGDDPNGGPEDAIGTIHVVAVRVRKKLAPAGVKLRTISKLGFTLDRPAREKLLGMLEQTELAA